MSLKSAPFYWLECDGQACTEKSTEGSEYSAWDDVSQAIDDAECGDWIVKHAGDVVQLALCSDCSSTIRCPECGEEKSADMPMCKPCQEEADRNADPADVYPHIPQ